MKRIPRPEHPRPQMQRDQWLNLNGTWQFETDHGKSGRARGLFDERKLDSVITVPFCPESELSGVNNKDFMECVWYKREADIKGEWLENGRRTLLHIDACDHQTEVWVNGSSVGTHIGGYVSFLFDITRYLKEGNNIITVCATDLLRSNNQPGGKQSTGFYSKGCNYTRTTGIWQTVWLENVADSYIASFRCTPNIENSTLHIDALCVNAHGQTVTATAYYKGHETGSSQGTVSGKHAILEISLYELH
ncbi:MAG: sugar-binding domain-containing protein, partial [Clostridia bacterium]